MEKENVKLGDILVESIRDEKKFYLVCLISQHKEMIMMVNIMPLQLLQPNTKIDSF